MDTHLTPQQPLFGRRRVLEGQHLGRGQVGTVSL